MGYIPSINIEHNKFSDFRYIVTENAKLVVSGIINGYNAGLIHLLSLELMAQVNQVLS